MSVSARTVVLAAAFLTLSVPQAARAQACPTGAASYYTTLPTCTIGSLSVGFSNWYLTGGANAIFTPLSGSDANGSYFGFSLKDANGGNLFSNTFTGQYDPNDPSHLVQGGTTNGLFWTINNPFATTATIFRTAVTTVNSTATTTSQPQVGPTLINVVDPNDPNNILGTLPDVNTGCGWSGVVGYDGNTYSAARNCGFMTASSNNWVWDVATTSFSSIAWSIAGSGGNIYGTGDSQSQQCWLGSAGLVSYTGSTCDSYHDLNGFDLGAQISGGSIAAVSSMDNNNQDGWVDPNGPGVSGTASVDEYDVKLYYSTTPEPATLGLLGLGLGALAAFARRRQRSDR